MKYLKCVTVLLFKFGTRKKSKRSKSGEYGACDKTVTFSDFTSSDLFDRVSNMPKLWHRADLVQLCHDKRRLYMQSRKLQCIYGSFGNYRLSTVFGLLYFVSNISYWVRNSKPVTLFANCKMLGNISGMYSYPFLVICQYTQISYVRYISYLQNTLQNEMHL